MQNKNTERIIGSAKKGGLENRIVSEVFTHLSDTNLGKLSGTEGRRKRRNGCVLGTPDSDLTNWN